VLPTRFLDLDDALRIIARLSLGPVRDIGLLDSALARPKSRAFGEDAYPTLVLKASALLHSLVKNHCLVDGNKRLAWLATTVFLDINGFAVTLSDDDAFNLVWTIASGDLDVTEIGKRLGRAVQPAR